MDPGFWKKKKVLVTGHTGFKGSWLSLWLELAGADILGYSLPPSTNPSLFELTRPSKTLTSVIGDIRDLDFLNKTIRDFQPEIIFHLAAQALVKESYRNPLDTYTTNVIGTANLLECVKSSPGTRAVVVVTSDKCYENHEWLWGYREIDPMGGHDPYSSSKGCAELVASAYRNSFFSAGEFSKHRVAVASARAGNVIGGGDWSPDRLVPDLLKSFLSGQTVLIRHPEAIRPWQHVLDPVGGYLELAERLCADGPIFAEAWNFGPHDTDVRSVGWIVENLVRLWGEGARWQKDSAAHPHEARLLKLDCSKAHMRLGWRPKLDLKSALEWIVEWAYSYRAGAEMRDVSIKQIEKFMSLSS